MLAEDTLVRKHAERPFVPKSCSSHAGTAGSAEPHAVLLVLDQIYLPGTNTLELVRMFGAAAFGARPRGTAQDHERLLELKGAGVSIKDIARHAT